MKYSRNAMLTGPHILGLVLGAILILLVVNWLTSDESFFGALADIPERLGDSVQRLFGHDPDQVDVSNLKYELTYCYQLNRDRPGAQCTIKIEERIGDVQEADLQPDNQAYTVVLGKMSTNPSCLRATIRPQHQLFLEKC